ncbi:hypothetical protein [Parvularcula sp. LCG005]|uniref:hypothetical protein n=1 Tax=Parvularcula sp. LCG005 TaxID=3078805 RepID=UPI00294338E6|nr:hypothetical protein [Parvularcula sp. LCG005]WOI54225.1 hypothetical protein RUI03_04310 [Parvularcula sp. LCG005]
MRIVTIGPFLSLLQFAPGIDPRSDEYPQILASLPADSGTFEVPNRRVKRDFDSVEADDYDLRLFVWRPTPVEGEPQAAFHIYPYGASVVRLDFTIADNFDADALEADTQALTRQAFDRHSAELNSILKKIHRAIKADFVEPLSSPPAVSAESIRWVARAVVVSEADRNRPDYEQFYADWLTNTSSPEDVELLKSGDIDHSMTWLNYIVIGDDMEKLRPLFSTTRTAQMFYAAQDRLSDEAFKVLSKATVTKGVRGIEAMLIRSRAHMQMLQILHDRQLGLLSRSNRRRFDGLMEAWDFSKLIENGNRIVDMTSRRIDEINTRRTEKSSFYTDLILVGIAMLTVVEVSLYFSEYSREMMSRPALEYTDASTSSVMAFIASVDTDMLLLMGFSSVFILVLLYVYWKLRR